MVTIKDGCGCDPCDCDWKQKLKEAYSRAIQSVNKIGDDAGSIYYPDGTGYVKLPLPTRAQVAQIQENADDIATLKQRTTASEGDIDILEQDVVRIDAKDTAQDTSIKDNSDRITSTNNDLISTEATVATHDSDIITLKAQTDALGKSLVSDVIMTDGTSAGSVQVSIEREDGALITSANYKWGRDIGVRLEAGTQAGYMKTVIDLSDGTTLTSNEYKIVEVLESDVYVTAITLVPDMTAGTIGGNISYSNGTTQTINAVNVPTAPGVTSAIEALQSRMTTVENTNNTQSSEITALTNRVQAIEDTPGVGQFGAGKLGTIAGSAVDGRVAAEDDGTGSVNGWSALKDRVTTAEGQIVTAKNDISTLDGTVAQQTTDISKLKTDVTNIQNKDTAQDQSIAANASAIEGKVSIAQGADNAGKALVVGEDGNVALGSSSSKDVIFFTVPGIVTTTSSSSVTFGTPLCVYSVLSDDSGYYISPFLYYWMFIPTTNNQQNITCYYKTATDDDKILIAKAIVENLSLPDGTYSIQLTLPAVNNGRPKVGAHGSLYFQLANGFITITNSSPLNLYSLKKRDTPIFGIGQLIKTA